MKPKPFWELKNLTVPVVILAPETHHGVRGPHNHLHGPISGFGVFLGKALSGKCKAGEISNVAYIGVVPLICNGSSQWLTTSETDLPHAGEIALVEHHVDALVAIDHLRHPQVGGQARQRIGL